MVFFAKNKTMARQRLKKLREGMDREFYLKYNDVRLAQKQITPCWGKTYECISSNPKRTSVESYYKKKNTLPPKGIMGQTARRF